MHHYRYRNAREGGTAPADVIKLTFSVLAQLLLFAIWLALPSRERYEIVVHIALPLLIVVPLLKLRYLIIVPFLAFVPDIARLFDVDIFHSIGSLPLVFVAAALPFLKKLRAALTAGYAAMAIIASHMIVDVRTHAVIESIGGYSFYHIELYALLLTVGGFLLVHVLNARVFQTK